MQEAWPQSLETVESDSRDSHGDWRRGGGLTWRHTRSVARLSGFKSQLHPLYQLCAPLCPRCLFFMTKQAQPCMRIKGLMLVKCEAYPWHTGSTIKIKYSSWEGQTMRG